MAEHLAVTPSNACTLDKRIAPRKMKRFIEFSARLTGKSKISALHKKAPKNSVKKQKFLLTFRGTFVILLERLRAGTGRTMR
jgi:hypothetical protein